MIRFNEQFLLEFITNDEFQIIEFNQRFSNFLSRFLENNPDFDFSKLLKNSLGTELKSAADSIRLTLSLPDKSEMELRISQLKLQNSVQKRYLFQGLLRQTVINNTLEKFINEQFLEYLKNSENFIAAVISARKKIVFWNKGAEKISGYPPEKTTNSIHIWTSFFPSKIYRKTVLKTIDHFLSGQSSTFTFVTQIRTKFKETKLIEWDVQLIKNMNREIEGIFLIGHDRSQEIEMMFSSLQAEIFYRALFDEAKDAIFLMQDGMFIECNTATLKIFGCKKRSEIIGHKPWEFSPAVQPDGSPSIERAQFFLKKAIRGEAQRFQWVHLKKSGEEIYTDVTLNRIQIGEKTYIQSIVRDISEQVELKNQIIHNEQKLRAIMESLPNPVFYKNRDGIFEGCNKAYCETMGMAEEEIIGKTIFDLAPPKLAVQMAQHDHKIWENKEKVHYETFIENANGELRDTIIYKSPLMGNDGHVLGLVGVMLDITETKIAQSQLQLSEHKFRTLSEFAPVSIMIYRDNYFIYANQEAKKLTGYTEEELTKMKFWQIVHPDDEALVKRRGILRQKGEEIIKRYEFRIVRKDGKAKWISLKAETIEYENNNAVIVSAIDISESKRKATMQEVMMRVAEIGNHPYSHQEFFSEIYKELGKLFEISNLFFGLYDAEKNTFTFPFLQDENDAFEEIPATGTISKLVIDSRKPLLLKKDDMLKLEIEKKIKLVGTPSACWMGCPLSIENSVEGIIVVQSYTDKDAYDQEDLQILEFVSNQIAMTLKRRNEKEKNQRLIKALTESPVGTIITNKEGIIEYSNPILLKNYGYTLSELIGEKTSVFKSGFTSDEKYKALWNTILSGKIWEGELQNRRKDGSILWERLLISPVKSEEGEITHFVAIKEDIDQKKKMEERMIQTERLESLGMLVGGIAHDFNNLLTAINGFAEIGIMKTEENEGHKKYFQSILESGKTAAGLTKQLLAFSRKQTIQPELISVSDFLGQKLPVFRRLIPEDITIKTNLTNEEINIFADPVQLEQIVINLMVNARDAILSKSERTEKNIKITCTTSNLDSEQEGQIEIINKGSYVVFSVADTGSGIPDSIRNKIFEPFFTTKERGQGTGLGLATVYGIIKQNNGFIDIETEPGIGTTFRIYWPLNIQEKSNNKPTDSLSFPTAEIGEKTILLVEDDSNVRTFAQHALEQLGFNILLASDGLEAKNTVEKHMAELDLIITDKIMPGMNGPELIKLLEKGSRPIPVVLISGYEPEKDLDATGSTSIIQLKKPFTLSQLEKAIHQAFQLNKEQDF